MLSLLESTTGGVTVLLLALGAALGVVTVLRWQQFRLRPGREALRERKLREHDQRRLRQSLDDLLVELDEASRRVSALVDATLARLEARVRDADERIARLEHLLAQADPEQAAGAAQRDVGGEAGYSADFPAACGPGSPRPSEAGNGPASRTATGQTDPAAPAAPRVQRVYELIDAGRKPIEVAAALGVPLGEVELILNLRRYR